MKKRKNWWNIFVKKCTISPDKLIVILRDNSKMEIDSKNGKCEITGKYKKIR